MEFLEGQTLDQLVEQRGALPLAEVTEIVRQTGRALDAAHQAGVVHRDLKPDNILLARDPDALRGYVVKIVDFGIAKIVQDEAACGANSTQAGMILGTPHYMSPEALTATAPVSAASDIWSLGACAFAAACARAPFEGDAIGDVVLKVCSAPLPIPSHIEPRLPKAFDAWFARACARHPSERFCSVREMTDALERLGEWLTAQRENTAYELRPYQPSSLELELDDVPRASNRSMLLAGMLGGVALTIGALGWYVMQRTREANEMMARSAASASAIVEASSERRLSEADQRFWGQASDAGAQAALDAGRPDRRPARSGRRAGGAK
jgi:serine/threonine-protein kinase